MPPVKSYLASSLLTVAMLIVGCADDLCEEHSPGFQVDLTLSSAALAVQVQRLSVDLFVAGLQKQIALDPQVLKATGSTSFSVVVGEAGGAGFRAEISVEVLDPTGARLLFKRQDFDGSGDACNFFSMNLDPGPTDDQHVPPPPSDAGADAGADAVVDTRTDGPCAPQTCAALGVECGSHDDGCDGTLHCPNCGDGQNCVSGQCEFPPVDCSGIEANASFILCDSATDYCAGVFTQGEGCVVFCAAAGLVCRAHFGSGSNCEKEPQNVYACDEDTGHQNDWCECAYEAPAS